MTIAESDLEATSGEHRPSTDPTPSTPDAKEEAPPRV